MIESPQADDRPDRLSGAAAAGAARRPGPAERLGDRMTTKIVSWNIAKRHKPWKELVEMDADVALLQEVGAVPPVGGPRTHASPSGQGSTGIPTPGSPTPSYTTVGRWW